MAGNGAEGIIYISAASSPTGVPLIVLANEVSSTLSFYAVGAVVLDISLSSIEAKHTGSSNQITWSTASEVKGDVFEMEKSKNGTAFSHVAVIPAKGKPSEYRYLDEQPYQGLTHYRLKFKHISGSISYSPVVTAYVPDRKKMVQVYPNPVKDQLTIKANGHGWVNTVAEIVDLNGIAVKKIRLTARQATVDVSKMPNGVYALRYYDSGRMQTLKIIKQ